MKPDTDPPQNPEIFEDVLERATAWTGWPLDPAGTRLLRRLGEWLVDEALPAGGVGPNEAGRLSERHLVDSLLFAGAWRRAEPPETVVDLGTGVGLPGLPLALVWPTSEMVLVDLSGRRVRLARRAVRVLGLENVQVREADAARATIDRPGDLVVARAAGASDVVGSWARRWVRSDGCIVLGGSHRSRPDPGPGEEILSVPEDVLDRPVWLRKIAPA